MWLDEPRKQIYYLSQNHTFHVVALDGKVLSSVALLQAGTHALMQYPSLCMEGDVLHVAWTTSLPEKYLYWDIHYVKSPDGGKSWQKMDGTPLTPPIVADDTGPSDRISLDDEFEVHTWLSNFLVRDGKAHFLYLAQPPAAAAALHAVRPEDRQARDRHPAALQGRIDRDRRPRRLLRRRRRTSSTPSATRPTAASVAWSAATTARPGGITRRADRSRSSTPSAAPATSPPTARSSAPSPAKSRGPRKFTSSASRHAANSEVMRTIAHISDIHFNLIEPGVDEAVVADVHAQTPSLVIMSGDFTQRARAYQFRDAAQFMLASPGRRSSSPATTTSRCSTFSRASSTRCATTRRSSPPTCGRVTRTKSCWSSA